MDRDLTSKMMYVCKGDDMKERCVRKNKFCVMGFIVKWGHKNSAPVAIPQLAEDCSS